jgi:enoyl-CoA hydratase/carnithine racemase
MAPGIRAIHEEGTVGTTIDVQRDEAGVVTITLSRPESKNAMTREMYGELNAAFDEIAERPEDDRVLIITGAGDDFCSGADMSLLAGSPASSGSSSPPAGGDPPPRRKGNRLEMMRYLNSCALRLHRLPLPTIAAVSGVAVGAGCNLALGCDLILAAENARFSEIFPRRGLSIDFGGSWLLPRLVGLHKAKEIAFFGDILSANEAEGFGLVNRVVPAAELMTIVNDWAHRLADLPALQLSLIKRQLNQAMLPTMETALMSEEVAQALAFTSPEVGEAVQAFREKRQPNFRGA